MESLENDLQVGDKLTIKGLAQDGTIDERKPPRLWRVRLVTPEGANLQPLFPDGSVDEFNDVCGDFWIRRNT